MRKSVVLLLMLWLVMGCSDKPAPADEAVTVTDVLAIKAQDLTFDRTQLAVPAGAEVTVNLTNTGALEHNWVLVAATVEPATATVADAINQAASDVLAGGRSTTFTFTAPAAGNYSFVCTVPGHAAAGMVGALTVVP